MVGDLTNTRLRLKGKAMTHDELLAICDNYSFKDSAEPVKALRAVVELHKPSTEARNTHTKNPICNNCIEEYPCLTIQAIEGQLK